MKTTVQTGSMYMDGFGRKVAIVAPHPWEPGLWIGVLKDYGRKPFGLYMEDGRAYASTEKQNLTKKVAFS